MHILDQQQPRTEFAPRYDLKSKLLRRSCLTRSNADSEACTGKADRPLSWILELRYFSLFCSFFVNFYPGFCSEIAAEKRSPKKYRPL